MADEPRTAFLGLRSNVHFFASRQGFMNLESRVKPLALLYDRLVFEDGVYECTVGEQGTSAIVHLVDMIVQGVDTPAPGTLGAITVDLLDAAYQSAATGQKVAVHPYDAVTAGR